MQETLTPIARYSAPGDPSPLVAQGLSVSALAALLARCDAYIGADTGPTHLAGLLGLPTIALFGPTNPAIWAPLGQRVTALQAPQGELAQLSAETVATTLLTLLP